MPTENNPSFKSRADRRAQRLSITTSSNRFAIRALSALLLLLSTGIAVAQAQRKGPVPEASGTALASDERVVFFTTAARLSADKVTWIVPVHGRVYRPEQSTVRKAVLAKAIQARYGIVADREQKALFDERIDLLLGDNKGGRRLTVVIAGKDYPLPQSNADGHFTAVLQIKAADLEAEARAGRMDLITRPGSRDPRTFKGTVLLAPPKGRSVISDIDDTVKVTYVTDSKRMMESTFLKPFAVVPGISRIFQTWAAEGTTFHFVSSTPWHLYEPIATFLDESGFPPATITLKQIRLKDSSITNIFADATKTKPPEIERLLKEYPERTFVLVGDSGEKDPEIYADFLRRYPQRIEKIFIRNVGMARREDARFTKVFAGIDPARWEVFTDASELPHMLGR